MILNPDQVFAEVRYALRLRRYAPRNSRLRKIGADLRARGVTARRFENHPGSVCLEDDSDTVVMVVSTEWAALMGFDL